MAGLPAGGEAAWRGGGEVAGAPIWWSRHVVG